MSKSTADRKLTPSSRPPHAVAFLFPPVVSCPSVSGEAQKREMERYIVSTDLGQTTSSVVFFASLERSSKKLALALIVLNKPFNMIWWLMVSVVKQVPPTPLHNLVRKNNERWKRNVLDGYRVHGNESPSCCSCMGLPKRVGVLPCLSTIILANVNIYSWSKCL